VKGFEKQFWQQEHLVQIGSKTTPLTWADFG